MKAAFATKERVPVYGDFPAPKANDGHVVADVLAAALTNLDIAVAEGRHYFSTGVYPAVVGREFVGRIGAGERRYFNVNAIVSPYGSIAEQALVDPAFSFPVPDDTPDDIAAALGNAGLAAWLPLSWRARMAPGETVLVLGATGATGLIAVAAARLLGAGRVVAAGRNPVAMERAKRLGADAVVDLACEDLASAFARAAGGGIDVVIDYLNGPPAEAALQAMAKGGRMVQIGQMAGASTNLPAPLGRKNALDVLGFAYYHAPIAEQADAYARLCACANAGKIEIDIETLSRSEIETAWRRQKTQRGPRFVFR